jgi:hypothetical protein
VQAHAPTAPLLGHNHGSERAGRNAPTTLCRTPYHAKHAAGGCGGGGLWREPHEEVRK